MGASFDRVADTTGHLQRLVHCKHNIGNQDRLGVAREPVSAPRAPSTIDKTRPAQL